MFDFNNADRQSEWFTDSLEQQEARLQVHFECLLDYWLYGLSRLFEPDEIYDPKNHKAAFLKFCAAEFDRLLERPRGPAESWPRKPKVMP